MTQNYGIRDAGPAIPLLLPLVLCACIGGFTAKPRPDPPQWPTHGWATSTPESLGMDAGVLAETLARIRAEGMAVHSLLIVRHGRLVLEAYFHPYSGQTPHDVASVTKSITATLVEIARRKGYIEGFDRPVAGFFPAVSAPSFSRPPPVTLRDLLRMASGLECGYGAGEPELFSMMESPDWTADVLGLPRRVRPGSAFAYCSGNTHLLSAILTRTTGSSALAFARRHLLGPLGIREVEWPSDPAGVSHGWGDLRMHPRDMAKIGLLYLHDGRWGDHRILSATWVSQATRKQIRPPGRDAGYGYGWWISPAEYGGMYEARGRGGQRIIVWPEKDLVVVTTGAGFDLESLAGWLLPSLKSEGPLPANPEAVRRLRDQILAAARPPSPGPASPLPNTAGRIAGRTLRLYPNKLGIDTLSLVFDDRKTALLHLTRKGCRHTLRVGLDNVHRITDSGPTGVPVALTGRWTGEQTFLLQYTETAGPNRFDMEMKFSGSGARLNVTDPTGYFGGTIAADLEGTGRPRPSETAD